VLEDRDKLRELIKEGLKELSEGEQKIIREEVKGMIEELEERDADHLSLTDKESRMMKNEGKTRYSYNAQVMVDDREQIIVGAKVVNEETDSHQLAEMLEDSFNRLTLCDVTTRQCYIPVQMLNSFAELSF